MKKNSVLAVVTLCVITVVMLCGLSFAPGSKVLAETTSAIQTTHNATQQVEPFVWEDYQAPGTLAKSPSLIRTVFSFTIKLLIVILLVYITVRALKLFYAHKPVVNKEGESDFAILQTFYLKQNQALYLVKVIGRYFVLGITSQSISVVCEITDAGTIQSLQEKETEVRQASFSANLAGLLGKRGSSIEDRIAESSQKILDHINKLSRR